MKRFTETSKWGDVWFRKLKPTTKLLWQWLLDNCDAAGYIEPDMGLASFQIGYEYPMDTLCDTLSELGEERVKSLGNNRYFIVKFIAFQYGELSTECKAHNPVFSSLERHNLKGYAKGIHTPQDMDKDKDKDKKGVKGETKRPTLEEVRLVVSKVGLPDSDAVWFWNKCEANGWTNGGRPIKSFSHTIAAWKAGGYMPSQKNGMKAAPAHVGGHF